MYSISRYPHDLNTKFYVVSLYRNGNPISFVCRRYKCSKASLMRWNKKFDGTKDSLIDKSHKPLSPHPNAHTEQELYWIKNFPKSYWLKFTSDTNVQFAMDNFHFKKALVQLTTQKYPDICKAMQEYIDANNKKDFNMIAKQFKDLFPERTDVIESKQKYILNNWKERQTYLNNPHMKCSMESHISHILADLFTARPKAYSANGLKKLLKLRLLKVNKVDIKKLYLNQLITSPAEKQINRLKKILIK